MRILIRTILITVLLSGCYATTDKYNTRSEPVADLSWYPPVPAEMSSTEFRKIYNASEHFYSHTLTGAGFSGGFLVAKKGNIIYENYTGLANRSSRLAIDSLSSFHLASVSKTFTGMAVLKLWEEGKVNLQDDISRHLAGFPYPGVTVRSLLNHRSGLPNYVHFLEQAGWDKKITVTNQSLLDFIIANPRKISVGKPDRGFSYSNTNYALLALLIEKLSGMSYADYLRKTFFEPLHMNQSFVFDIRQADQVMPSYNWKNQEEAITYLDAVYGDKNIYSSPRDLLKWDLALTYGNLFRQSTLDSAYKGYSFEKPGIKNYGLGWRMYNYPDGNRIIYHNGWWHGNNTVFTRLIQDSATVIVLGNKFNRRIYDAKKLYPVIGGYGPGAEGDD